MAFQHFRDSMNQSAVIAEPAVALNTLAQSSETPALSCRGAEILIRGLIANGVDTIFGLPGGAVLHIYDELWRYRNDITHYLVRHEQGAVLLPERICQSNGKGGRGSGYFKFGATNAVTGIATAYMDSIPLVVITRTSSDRFDRN